MEISARRFDANGNPLGEQFFVNQTTTYNQYAPSVGVDAWGNFVVGWTSEHQDGWECGVYARLYAADGTARTNEIRINDTWVNNQWMDMCGLGVAPDGTFAAAWSSGFSAN